MSAAVIVFIFLIAAVYYALTPFMSDKHATAPEIAADEYYSADELKKINLFRQIKEVEFEKEMGTIDPEDFQRVKSELMHETKVLMDTLEAGQSPVTKKTTKNLCPSCSKVVPAGSKFCGNCGTAVK